MSNSSLVIIEKAALLLVEADTIQKCVELKSLFLTSADWARRKGMGESIIKTAHSYAIQAEVKMGEILAATKRAKGTRGQLKGNPLGGTPMVPPKKDKDAPTLAEIGVSRKEAAAAQFLATLPDEIKAQVISGDKSKIQAKREVKEAKRESRREENRKIITETPELASIIGKFATIVIDPPWDWGDEGDVNQLGRAKPDYATMSLEELYNFPVEEKADIDCHLYLWITNRSLPKGFGLLEKWGFRYITCLTWCKDHFGMGNYFRGQTEHILFGVKGSQPLKRKDAGTFFNAPRPPHGHSSKPDEFYQLIESCSPGPYLDIFGRRERIGWVVFGETLAT